MAEQSKAINNNWWIYLACAGLLVATGLWRVVVPGTEYGSSTLVWFGIVVDAMILLGLIGLYRQLSVQFTPDDSRRGLLKLAFWAGLIAGVVVFAIRLTSDHGWWTGHLRFVVE